MAIKKPQVLSAPSVPVQASVDTSGATAAQMFNEVKAEVSPEAAPLWNFVLTHAKELTMAVVLLVVVILAIAGWKWHAQTVVQDAKVELGRIVSQASMEKRYDALQKFAADAPEEVAQAVTLEIATTAVFLQKWDDAADAYARIVSADEGDELSPMAVAAWMNRLDLLLRQGKGAEVVKEMDAMMPRVPHALKPLNLARLGLAAEIAGDKARAASAYEEFLKALPPAEVAQAGYYKARIAALK